MSRRQYSLDYLWLEFLEAPFRYTGRYTLIPLGASFSDNGKVVRRRGLGAQE